MREKGKDGTRQGTAWQHAALFPSRGYGIPSPKTPFQQMEPCMDRDSRERPLLTSSCCYSPALTSLGCFSEQERGHGDGHPGITLRSKNHREPQAPRTAPRVPPSLPEALGAPNPATLQHLAVRAERRNSRTGKPLPGPRPKPTEGGDRREGALLCPASAVLPGEGCFTSSSLPIKINNKVDVKQKSGASPKPLETAGT